MYRLLALAIVFALAGVFFFLYDRYAPKHSEETSTPKIKSSRDFLDPVLSRFPPPEKFTKISLASGTVNGLEAFSVFDSCNDAYVTLLVFPADLDYRRDVTKAVMNRAFPCRKGTSFSHPLSKNDFTTAPDGDYYLIVADQGTSETWYNPR